jgi:hypothetical protein
MLLAALSLTWSGTDLKAASEPSAPTSPEVYQLLTNPDMEQVFISYGAEFRGAPCQVATGWTRFGDNDPRPCWMDARVFAHQVMGTDWVEFIDSPTSQVVISTDPYVSGIYQQVGGLTAGLPYGFHAAMMTIYQSSYGPPQHGHMIKQVGMDPTGGTNPDAPTVVWSEPQDRDYGWDVQRRTAVVATSKTMTVFIRVTSPYDPGEWPYVNQSFFDSAILARTATVSAVSPEVSLEPTFTVRWDDAQASPDATIRWYDTQWMDEADGQWVDWLIWTEQTQATFTGQQGHTYRFRARAWQRYPNGAHLYSPYEPEAGTTTTIATAQLVGVVRGNGAYSFGGTRVSILGTPYETVSRQDGSYQMWTEPMDDPHTVAVSNPPWLSPEPVHGVTFGLMETVALTWTLRPPDDAVENGGFEGDLSGWQTISEQGVMPEVVTDPVHTGEGAVALGGEAAESRAIGFTTGLTQTVALARSWDPNLSFWYLPETTDSDDLFEVTLTVVGDSASSDLPAEATTESLAVPSILAFTPSLDADGWQHRWYSLGVEDAYFTGTVTIHFEVWNDGDEFATTVYLDEASLGRTPGGPFRTYFPLISR